MKKLLARVLAIVMAITVMFMPNNYVVAETNDKVIKNDETGIPDENLYNILLEKADANEDNNLTTGELKELKGLDIGNSQIGSLKGLEYCTNLITLWCYDNQVEDLTPLTSLTTLTQLDLRANNITDISCLSNLTNLTNLNLSENQINDITAVRNLKNLLIFLVKFIIV